MFFFSPLYLIIVGPAILFSLWAQYKVRSAFSKFSEVDASSGLSGAQLARNLLDRNGLSGVKVEPIEGELTDHYDPRSKTLRLSRGVYQGYSLAAHGVAAHETGHALQDARSYVPLRLRAGLFPVANFGSQLGPILILIGLFFIYGRSLFGQTLVSLGIITFSIAVLFQIVTLPVELNASRHAMAILQEGGYIYPEEYQPTRQVLNAAALTYLAAALAAVLQLIYFILLSRERD